MVGSVGSRSGHEIEWPRIERRGRGDGARPREGIGRQDEADLEGPVPAALDRIPNHTHGNGSGLVQCTLVLQFADGK